MDRFSRRAISSPLGAALVLGALLPFGCGDSAGPSDEPSGPESASGFLTRFAIAYTTRDGSGYAALLDSGYVFELIPEEADTGGAPPLIDRAEELRIAENMFEKRPDAQGRSLRDIALGFILKGTTLDETPYPNKPPGETWLRITAFADLLVVVSDPSAPLGYFPFEVASDQVFVVRPDPAGSGRFLVVRQIDPPPAPKDGVRAETVSWSTIKRFFRW